MDRISSAKALMISGPPANRRVAHPTLARRSPLVGGRSVCSKPVGVDRHLGEERRISMSKRGLRVAAAAAAVVLGSAIGVTTNIVTDRPTVGWIAALVTLVLSGVALQTGVALLEPRGATAATAGGAGPEATSPAQSAHPVGLQVGVALSSTIATAGRDVRTGYSGGQVAGIVAAAGAVAVAVLAVTLVLAPPGGDGSTGPAPEASTAAPTTTPPEPFDIVVMTDPKKFRFGDDQINTTNEFLFPTGSLERIEKPSTDKCYEWHAWARRNNAADLLTTNIAINVSALTSDTVQILGAELVVETGAEPIGDVAACQQGGQTTASYLDIDLDQRSATYRYKGDQPTPLALNILPGKPERIYIKATTQECFCRWFLDLDITVAGMDYTYRVSNNGRPFVTVPSSENYRYYYFDAFAQAWKPL